MAAITGKYGYSYYNYPSWTKESTPDTGSAKKKKASVKYASDFRQPVSYNDVNYNPYPSYNFTTLPTYNNGMFAGGNMGIPLTLFDMSGKGWIAKGGMGAELATYYDSELEAKRVSGAGINASFYGATPKLYIKDVPLYMQVAMGLSSMTMGDKTNVHMDINSFNICADDMPFFGRNKFSASFQYYLSCDTQGAGAESYRTLFGTGDLNDISNLYRFNLRFELLDLPNYLQSTLNLYAKWGQPAGYDKLSAIYGLTFDNHSGTNANVELWNKGGVSPLLNIVANQRIFKLDKGTVNLNIGLEDVLNPRQRGYSLGLSLNLTKVKILGTVMDVVASVYYKYTTKDTKEEVQPGEWGSKDIDITQWSTDPLIAPDQVSQSIDYTSDCVGVTKDTKLTATICSANENGLPGIVGKLGGTDSTEHVDVTVNSVEVQDVTDKKNPKVLSGVGSEIVGRTLDDVLNGALEMDLPISNGSGYIQYYINIKCVTNKSDLDNTFPAPYTTSCKVRLKLLRE